MASKLKAAKYFVTQCFVSFQRLTIRKGKLFSACSGFTLVELLVVGAILAVLTSMALPFFSGYINSVKEKACIADLRTIDKAIYAYVLEKNALPADLTAAGVAIQDQLDPWHRPFEYHDLTAAGATPLENIAFIPLNTDYDLYSKGKDGTSYPAGGDPANTDDIARSSNGSYAGVRP